MPANIATPAVMPASIMPHFTVQGVVAVLQDRACAGVEEAVRLVGSLKGFLDLHPILSYFFVVH